MHVICEVMESFVSGEALIEIVDIYDKPHKALVPEAIVKDGRIPVSPHNQAGTKYEVELPHATTTGGWRIWVDANKISS